MFNLDSYTYSCNEGYATDDEMCTVCQPDGTLSLETLPNCSSKLASFIVKNIETNKLQQMLLFHLYFFQNM